MVTADDACCVGDHAGGRDYTQSLAGVREVSTATAEKDESESAVAFHIKLLQVNLTTERKLVNVVPP